MDGAFSSANSQMDELKNQITTQVADKFNESMIQSDTIHVADAQSKIAKYPETIDEAKVKLEEAYNTAKSADNI